MGLEKTIEKLDMYQDRLKAGKAHKIKAADLAKAERKLKAKEETLLAELEEAIKADKRERLERKLALVREQQARVTWLAEQLDL